MEKLIQSLKWLDNNIVKIMTIVFIFLMPLYPKFPLMMLRDTYIAIRAEDVFMIFYVFIFMVQLLRKKVVLNKTFLWLFVGFWIAVFLSFFWGYYVQKSFIFQYIGFLHAARRVEYMIVFFIAASSIRKREDFYHYLNALVSVVAIVCIYGLGQKFIGLPAVQTMNAEFAKGMLLFLTPEARVSSTFAGHYDLAAYLVFLIPIVIGYHIFHKKIWSFLTFVLGVAIIVMTASRSSFGAYVVSNFGFLFYVRKWRYLALAAIVTAGFMFTSGELTKRFADTFRLQQIYVNDQGAAINPQESDPTQLPGGTFTLPSGGKELSDAEKKKSAEQLEKQTREQVEKEAVQKGQTLTKEQIEELVKKRMANFTPVVAYTADISFATRLQVSWPRAVNAFKVNPLLGTGPSSITEASDSSFFRWIGEFGLLGTSFFMAILLSLIVKCWLAARQMKEAAILYYSFIFGLIGLTINGTYIDVFEASKVAYTLWVVAGIFIGAIPFFIEKQNDAKPSKTK